MQTEAKYFDFSAKGDFGNTDKVAIKLSGKSEVLTGQKASDFLKIMGAMMTLDPEQVEASQDQLQGVPQEGEDAGGFAPLIDLSSQDDDPHDMLELLMGKTTDGEASMELDDDDEDCCPCSELAGSAQVAMDDNPVPANETIFGLNGGADATGISDPGPIGDTSAASVSNSKEVQNQPALNTATPESADPGTTPNPSVQKIIPDGKNPLFADQQPDQAKAQPDSGKVQDGSGGGTGKAALNDPGIQPPITETSDRSHGKASAAPQVIRSAAAVAASDGSMDAGAQETASGETVVREAVKATGLDRALKSVSKKPANSKAPMAPAGQQPASHSMKHAMADKVKVAADPAEYSGQPIDTEAEEGVPAKSSLDDGGTTQRAPAGRDGFQGMMSRLSSHAAKGVDHMSADKPVPEPSKELQTDVMRQIVQRMTLRSQGSQAKMQIQLKPEFLGNVHMQISTDNQQVVVRMMAESMVVKEMIEQHLSFLKTELQQHGLQIERFDVQVGNDSEGWKNSQDPSDFRQALKNGQHHQKGRQRREQSGNSVDAPDDMVRKSGNNPNEIDYFA